MGWVFWWVEGAVVEAKEVRTSEKRSSSGWNGVKVEEENGILWVLLHEQALQCVEEDNELENDKENLETIFFIIVNYGWPSLECHLDEVVLTLENASNGEEVT